MNVLLVPSSYLPNAGGVERVTHGLAIQLTKLGWGVRVAAPRWPGHLAEREIIDGVRVERYDFALPGKAVSRLGKFASRAWRTRERFKAMANSFRPDVVHVHCLGPNTLYGVLLATSRRIPVILTTHGEFQGDDTGSSQSISMTLVRKLAFACAHTLTAPSVYTLNHVPGNFQGMKVVIPNPVESSTLDERVSMATVPFIFTAARLTYNKGVDLAIQAFAKGVPALDDEVELWLAGDGQERQSLEQLARELGVERRVRFLGDMAHAEVQRLMAACRFYLCPSRNEAFGLSILEAMAAGKAVVAGRTGGIPEIVMDGESGLLVEMDNSESLARAILRLSESRRMREQLGRAGRDRASLYSWGHVAKAYEEAYHLAMIPKRTLGSP